MKKYKIRVECNSFQDITVEAKNVVEAYEIAEKQFDCPNTGCQGIEHELIK